jgi:hypothetical protein
MRRGWHRGAHVWEADSDPDRLQSCPLIMVAVEQAVTHRFSGFLTCWHLANELDQVVFDECQLATTAVSYRAAMGLLPMLRKLAVQMIFLMGAMPPSMVRIVRRLTIRRDTYFHFSRCPPKRDFVREFAVPGIQYVIRGLAADPRAIINCSIKECGGGGCTDDRCSGVSLYVWQRRGEGEGPSAMASRRTFLYRGYVCVWHRY